MRNDPSHLSHLNIDQEELGIQNTSYAYNYDDNPSMDSLAESFGDLDKCSSSSDKGNETCNDSGGCCKTNDIVDTLQGNDELILQKSIPMQTSSNEKDKEACESMENNLWSS